MNCKNLFLTAWNLVTDLVSFEDLLLISQMSTSCYVFTYGKSKSVLFFRVFFYKSNNPIHEGSTFMT